MAECVWEWTGDEWVLQSGPEGCPVPLPPREQVGGTMTTPCPPGMESEENLEASACCGGGKCEPSVTSIQ